MNPMKLMRAGFPLVAVVLFFLTTGCRTKRGSPLVGEGLDTEIVPGLNGGGGDLLMPGGRIIGREVRGQFNVVYFDYDSSKVKDSEREKVERVAEVMRGDPSMQLVIDGHCDVRGSTEYNRALGERRALAIRAYLSGLGVDTSRVQTRSMGEEQPVALGSGEDAWQLNRRGEFVVLR